MQRERSVRDQGTVPFRALFPMLRISGEKILNYVNYLDYPYTNGFRKGKNKRIKVIKRVAYGYRNPHNFRDRIMLTTQQDVQPIAA